jgi:hypothetical protein
MMDDRALLEAAARAAGIAPDRSWGGGFDIAGNLVTDWHNWAVWRPLHDDGDALRLAVKVGMNVAFVSGHWTIVAAGFLDDSGDPLVEIKEPHGNDPDAATRRAITRAAAALAPALEGTKP